jgi:hypothetical protein
MSSINSGTTLPPPESRDLAEWRQLEDSDQDEEQEEYDRKRRWKGKSKDTDFRADDAELGIPNHTISGADEERADISEVGRSYPPLSEEAAEERVVVEVSHSVEPRTSLLI